MKHISKPLLLSLAANTAVQQAMAAGIVTVTAEAVNVTSQVTVTETTYFTNPGPTVTITIPHDDKKDNKNFQTSISSDSPVSATTNQDSSTYSDTQQTGSSTELPVSSESVPATTSYGSGTTTTPVSESVPTPEPATSETISTSSPTPQPYSSSQSVSVSLPPPSSLAPPVPTQLSSSPVSSPYSQTTTETPQSSIQTSTPPQSSSAGGGEEITSPTPSPLPDNGKRSSNSDAVSQTRIEAIVYSPYADNGQCKDKQTIQSDIANIASHAPKSIKIYATDCNTLEYAVPYAHSLGMWVNQGVWMGSGGINSADDQIQALLDFGSKNGWDYFSMILVGNEFVYGGYGTAAELAQKIQTTKKSLRAAGYKGPVGTAEPSNSYTSNKELCNSPDLDFLGLNSHPYFDPNANANTAGQHVSSESDMLAKACGKPVFVTETGYPSKGKPNGGNVPSDQNQATAIKSIIDATKGYATFLTAFDDYWKQPGPYGIEQSFGMLDLI